MKDSHIDVTAMGSIGRIGASEWDLCACPEVLDGGRPIDPFTTFRFLDALEQSRSVGRGTGWEPHFLVARLEGEPVAVTPLYAKGNSQGEYIFDHNIAHAYEGAGGRYYPKFQIAVPFTPATGRRFLARPGQDSIGRSALVQAAKQLTDSHNLSSLHITFCTGEEADAGGSLGLMRRTTQQFHWINHGYEDFDGFLAELSSRKRKNIRKERATAQEFGGRIVALTGDEIEPQHWDWFWRFYQDTGSRKWGSPYLTRDFFAIAHETMRDDILLILAIRDGRPVAGALNFIGRDTLYGRYWGCLENHPCLHFELCYYQAIDYAIAHGLKRVEAGAQGEHKLARGYLPVVTNSLHWFPDPGFAEAVGRYFHAERDAVDEEIEVLTSYGPFRRCNATDEH
jgi:predicted N-acyltransferase